MRTDEPLGFSRLVSLSIAVLGVLCGASVEGQVQVKVLEDGTKLIYNENETQRARRFSGRLLPVPSLEIDRSIHYHARLQGLSPRLVQAVVQVESGYNPRALSHRGAMGLMQLMPETARDLAVADPWDPDENIRGGTTYLMQMLRRFGDLEHSLAAYNAGPTTVEKHRGVPPFRETRDYVRKVLSLLRQGNAPEPPLLVREHARDTSREREESTEALAQERRGGDRVYLRRDASGRIVVSTAPNSK
jgi:hypothetical protein